MKINKKIGVIVSSIVFSLSVLIFATVYSESRLNTDVFSTTASTTPSYLTSAGGETTTLMFDTLGIDLVDLNIQSQASTTSSILNWKYEFSDDNIDWFGEDLAQTSSATGVSHASTTVTHTWQPDVTTVVRKNISIQPIASRYMRVVFSTTGANGAVWARVALKKELSR